MLVSLIAQRQIGQVGGSCFPSHIDDAQPKGNAHLTFAADTISRAF